LPNEWLELLSHKGCFIYLTLLWFAVVCSSVAVVHVNHLCRQKYGQLAALEHDANQFQEDYGRYLLEQSAWGSLQRVEAIATNELSMYSPEADRILIVDTMQQVDTIDK
jgi:cell division protein FtsL